MANKGITPRSEDYSQWYLDVIDRADLAENSAVRGCMVIKPYGYAIWENIRNELDRRIKELGAKNAYFPLFIPKSFFSKEASHVKGFAKECAIVTHYRLKETADGKGVEVDPKAKLEEELIVRPTSETIMYDTFSRWVTSWRDLPLKINQWANIVRWEKRTRPFLRTTEFLWQEGHTVHTTHEESTKQVFEALDMYRDFAREILALETYGGKKSESEKFAGAIDTYGVEALMQDGKALQFGTSHDLGQNFAKVFGISFTDTDGQVKSPWQTSWGVSTRMMGAVIMSHSDDLGLVLPPVIAPIKVVIIPIYKDENKDMVMEFSRKIIDQIKGQVKDIELDEREYLSPGFKFNEWEKKGVPVRIEIGGRDIERNLLTVVRRDTNEKMSLTVNNISEQIVEILDEIQKNLLERSSKILQEGTQEISSYDEFKSVFKGKKGFIKAYWCGNPECEESIKYESKATTRCFSKEGNGKCIYCGKDSTQEWVFAIPY
ncbi:MAG: prolyl-tRNA synthetase, prolyl-tRNA synthetase [candidate division WS6 bacterium GW2011_GWC1_33_20]|uniref:Proline--tRNA ligase n=2 Tax=Candidatus Dojkabacteria TaxID=74243 RepID=A0A0G0DGI1_9BACT|nr:MAG: prolyl-tRNA synthetase, prolyl-tRNA synthetase [candidate division WS6 bacterium GW2011_GWC1_33_20]KKP54467.1 MAG: Proline-tRNA ligase [candidate division WS6 bacterium GW2011_GWB1_33_6]HBB64604.1 proline--tRNA ligase [Patescibacteria group bacterium]